MFKDEDKLLDDINDDVSVFLKELCQRTKWTQVQKDLLVKTIQVLNAKKYMSFEGHPSKYHLYTIGESCLYLIPDNRRGHLKVFRGKKVRLVCVESGRFTRTLMAGLV